MPSTTSSKWRNSKGRSVPDLDRIHRESIRWQILNTVNKSRPYTVAETFVRDVLRSILPDVTPHEIRKELDYLEHRELLEIDRTPHGAWYVDITRRGVDVAEYTVECSAGIARPLKLWDD